MQLGPDLKSTGRGLLGTFRFSCEKFVNNLQNSVMFKAFRAKKLVSKKWSSL